MAVTTEIPWGDGSGDKIYLTRNASEGDQVVSVSSDANTGAARSKVVTFATGVGNVQRQLTINQAAGGPQEHTITLHPSSYDTENHSWYSASNISRGYTSDTSTTYATITCDGNGAEAFIHYKFDTSQIPDGATIVSVECKVKLSINGNSTTTPIKRVQMFTGLTAKGTPTAAGSSATTYDLDCGDWTLAELRDIRVRPYMKEGNSTTSRYRIAFYGATLTIKYIA